MVATRLMTFRRGRGGTLRDPVRPHRSWEATPDRQPTLAERRAALRAYLSAPRPPRGFAHTPAVLSGVASRGALRALARGDLGWAPEVARRVYRGELRAERVRPVALRVLARQPERVVELSPVLGLVGGAADVLEEVFERSRTEVDLQLAGALVRCRPSHVEAARAIARGLRNRDPEVRGKALCALTIWDGRGRGAGASLLRACLDDALARADGDTFFRIEHLLFDRSRPGFLRGCERLLSSRVKDLAAERLAAFGNRRQRAAGLAAGLRQRDFLWRWLFFGRHMPLDLRVDHVQAGLVRASPYERIVTSWPLDRETHRACADEIARALRDDPEPEVRRAWTARLRDLARRPERAPADRPHRVLWLR